jgi:hypothetical protein
MGDIRSSNNSKDGSTYRLANLFNRIMPSELLIESMASLALNHNLGRSYVSPTQMYPVAEGAPTRVTHCG